jgi:hypothetical protein
VAKQGMGIEDHRRFPWIPSPRGYKTHHAAALLHSSSRRPFPISRSADATSFPPLLPSIEGQGSDAEQSCPFPQGHDVSPTHVTTTLLIRNAYLTKLDARP